MYNNEVTYDEKWDTPENRRALEKLEQKYFNRSQCAPDCPVAWAPEVLELMENLDRELGICYNEHTMRGYYMQGNPLNWFLLNPFKGLFYSLKVNLFSNPNDYIFISGTTKREKRKRTLFGRVKAIFKGFFDPIFYGFRALIIRHVNPRLNKLQKRRLGLGQLKEKFGELRLYFSCPAAYEQYVENEIRKCEIKLALKGAYYPIENYWDAGVSYNIENEYEPDSVSVEYGEYNGERTVRLTKTTYRKIMKELGLNLKEIENKSILKKASKADPL